jgi:hypothetical protein
MHGERETPDIRRDKRGATKIDYHVVTHVHGCGVDVASVVSLSRLHAELEGRRVAVRVAGLRVRGALCLWRSGRLRLSDHARS